MSSNSEEFCLSRAIQMFALLLLLLLLLLLQKDTIGTGAARRDVVVGGQCVRR